METTPKTPLDDIEEDRKNFIMKELLFWLYHVFVVVVAALLITFAIRAQQQVQAVTSTDSYARAMETIGFWGKGTAKARVGYVIDIKAVSTMNCPQGYEPLINYQWDGTEQGCNCPTILNNYYYEFILPGICTADLIQNNCQRIPAVPPEPMNFWKGSKLLCVKRIKSLTFYNSTYPTSTQSCAAGQPYQVQTYLNVSCPVTTASNLTTNSSGQTVLTLNSTSGQSMFYQMLTGYPIADFKLSEYQFCPTYSQKNISPNKTGNYVLEPSNLTTCVGTDPRMVVFDVLDEQSLINNNINVVSDIALLPSYPRPSNVYLYHLGFIRYPTWTYGCRTNPSLNLTVVTSHMKLVEQTWLGSLVFSCTIGLAVSFGFLLRLFYTIRRAKQLKGKSAYGRVYEDERELAKKVPNLNYIHDIKLQVFWVIVDFLLTIALLVIDLIAVGRFSAISLWYKSVFQNGCTDSFLTLVLQNYEKNLDQCYYDLVVCIVLILLVLFFDVLFLIFRCIGGDLKRQQGSTIDNMDASSDDANRLNVPDDSMLVKDKDMKLDLDVQMEDGIERETKDNFYNVYGAEAELGVKKKKKKKPQKKRNLFKKDEQAKQQPEPE